MRRLGAAMAEFPDYLRLGLMLVLERRPEEPTARRRFLQMRRVAAEQARILYTVFFGDLQPDDIDQLVTLTMALADGVFVAQEAGDVDLAAGFDLMAAAVLGAADRLRAARRDAPSRPHS
jgi:hypothetical protein